MGRWSRIFPGRPSQVSEARKFMRAVLDGHSLVDSAVLVVSELATNALQHSLSGEWGGPFLVSVDAERESVHVSVVDLGSSKTPVMRSLDDVPGDTENGRGLGMVAALAKEWGAEEVASGTRVWVELTPDSVL